jgi:hypothetical protein
MTTLEEAMEEAQASMQQIIDDRAAQTEKANMHRLHMFMIGDFYEMVAAEKIENLRAYTLEDKSWLRIKFLSGCVKKLSGTQIIARGLSLIWLKRLTAFSTTVMDGGFLMIGPYSWKRSGGSRPRKFLNR